MGYYSLWHDDKIRKDLFVSMKKRIKIILKRSGVALMLTLVVWSMIITLFRF